MKLESYLIGLVVGLFAIVAGLLIISEQAVHYDIEIENQVFANANDSLNKVYNITADMKSKSEDQKDEGENDLDIMNIAKRAIKPLWLTPVLAFEVITDGFEYMGVHPLIINLVVIIVFILLVVLVITMMTRWWF